MLDIHLIRSSMLNDPENWKDNNFVHDLVDMITAPEILFLPDENWEEVYCKNHKNFWYSINSRVRTFAKQDYPEIDPNNKQHLRAMIRLAGTMSFCRVTSNDFCNLKVYKEDVLLPEGSFVKRVDYPTFSELIISFMQEHKSTIYTDIFDIILEDSKIWFKSILFPNTNLRIKAVERVFKNHGQYLSEESVFWLAYKKLFSEDLDFVKNIISEIRTKTKEIAEADPISYMSDLILEEKKYREINSNLDEWIIYWNDKFYESCDDFSINNSHR